jgi:hypothetical protein
MPTRRIQRPSKWNQLNEIVALLHARYRPSIPNQLKKNLIQIGRAADP